MNDKDIVVSTRIRLARNLRDYPFECKLSKEKRKFITEAVKDALMHSNSSIQERLNYIDMSAISEQEAVSMVERHLVSPELISDRSGRGLLLMDDESVSIMINEEDHIRLQVLKDGSSLDEAYDIADKIDTLLDERLAFAFDEKLGYLTECPTNIGTGMRASLMLHLPLLQENGAMNRISANLSKLGITIRGTYGEGTKAKGSLYQLSNQVTLGLPEQAAISNLKDISSQLISQERRAREGLSGDVKTRDLVGRSLGILERAVLLSNDEAMNLISNIRLGVSIGVVEDVSIDDINEILKKIQPATLVKDCKENMDALCRDEKRASIIRNKLFK